MNTGVEDKRLVFSSLVANRLKIRSYGVLKLSVFSNFLKGKNHPQSDIAFLIEFDSGRKTLENFLDLAFFLEDLLGRKVDLLTPKSLGNYLGKEHFSDAEPVLI